MDDLIRKLSEIRSKYNCFDEDEEPYYRTLSKAIRILSRHTDGDTISRQAASGCEYWDSESNFCSLHRPSAERRGRWMKQYGEHEAFGIRPFYRFCSECNEVTVFPYRYCPNCGTKMEAGE